MRGSRGVRGGPDRYPLPKKNHKAIGFPENHIPTKPVFYVGPPSARQRNAIIWRFAGWPMIARFIGVWILSSLIKYSGSAQSLVDMGTELV